MIAKIQPKDIVACLTLAFIFAFKAYGFDGALDSVLAMILSYYFVKRQYGQDKGV